MNNEFLYGFVCGTLFVMIFGVCPMIYCMKMIVSEFIKKLFIKPTPTTKDTLEAFLLWWTGVRIGDSKSIDMHEHEVREELAQSIINKLRGRVI